MAALPYADQSIYRAEWYYTIHCKYLLTWVETGIGGLITFLLVLATALMYGLKTWRSEDRFLASLGLAIVAGLLGSMLHMLVDLFNSRAQVQLLWVYIGLAAALYRLTTSAEGSRRWSLGQTDLRGLPFQYPKVRGSRLAARTP